MEDKNKSLSNFEGCFCKYLDQEIHATKKKTLIACLQVICILKQYSLNMLFQ